MKHWLMKSEPDVFSIQDLHRVRRETWDGVRNYQARNFMRDDMKPGDVVLFYHSSCPVPGVAGLAVVSAAAVSDPSAWNPKSDCFDPKSSPENPRWVMVEIEWKQTFERVLTLNQLRADPKLSDMLILRKGNRLSITPVTEAEYRRVVALAEEV